MCLVNHLNSTAFIDLYLPAVDEATIDKSGKELESIDTVGISNPGSPVELVLDGNPGDQGNIEDEGGANNSDESHPNGDKDEGGLSSGDKIIESTADTHTENFIGNDKSTTAEEGASSTDPENQPESDKKDDDVLSEADSDYAQVHDQNVDADISEAKPRYELTHWMYHLREAERLWTPEEREKSGEWARLWELVDRFLFESPAAFIRWQYTAWAIDYPYIFDADSLGKPIHVAAAYGLTALAERLLDRGVDVNSVNVDGMTALQLAATTQEPSTVELLLKRGANVHLLDCNQVTPLWRVAYKLNGNAKIAKLLLEGGSEPGVPDWTGVTPLHSACLNGNIEIFQLLVNGGADVKAKNNAGESPLHYALRRDPRLELIKELVRLGADVNEQDNNSQAPLYVVAVGSGSENTAIVKLLLDSGADVNDDDVFGFTALHCAAANGNLELVMLLAEKGAHLSLHDKNGNTALAFASQFGKTDVVRYLLQRFAAQGNESCITAVDTRGRTALHRAAAKGHEDIVEMLLAAENVDSTSLVHRSTPRATPLHVAAYQGHEMVVRVLLKNGGDVKAQNRLGETPIDLALKGWIRGTVCHEGAFNCLICMIKGTPESMVNDRSLLHIAAGKGSDFMMRRLLELGADPNKIDEHGWTPMAVAVQYGRPTIADILRSHPDLLHREDNCPRMGEPPTLFVNCVGSPVGISEDGVELHYTGIIYPENIVGNTN